MQETESSASPPLRVIRLLCVDDVEDDIQVIKFALKRADPRHSYSITAADDPKGFIEGLDRGIDVVLCDYNMPRFSPAAALKLLAERSSDIPLVLVTHSIGEEALVNLMREGSKDYVTKDKLATLPQVIARVLAERQHDIEDERSQRALAAANLRLRELSSHILAAQESERAIIARELHDVLGQTLTAAVIHMHAARNAADKDTATSYFDQALGLAKTAIDQIKTLSFSLRPPALNLLGLAAAVRADVQGRAEPAGLRASVTLRGTEPAQPGDNALVALRLIQEAVNNTVRHAHASRISVRLHFKPSGKIVVVVGDNGVGFDKAAVLDGAICENNLGLHGMIERASLAGGRLQFRTQPGSGVIVRATL
jgi:signal transduction histidine kinase